MSTTSSSLRSFLKPHTCSQHKIDAAFSISACRPLINHQLSFSVAHDASISYAVFCSSYHTKSKSTICKATGGSGGWGMDKGPEDRRANKSHFHGWKQWMAGIVLSILLPSFKYKWGPLQVLKNKVDMTMEAVDSVSEVVEEIAEKVEKVADEVGDKLPEDAKLKDALESVESIAREAAKQAELTQQLIDKLQEKEKEVEVILGEEKRNAQEVKDSTPVNQQSTLHVQGDDLAASQPKITPKEKAM
ncbi:hypothetical protein RJ641_011682 [Dillenia turbinata]|uniref:Uncharacterized protein n=1 Tax=Dillenia turbinata TaxID=194707 RepID=A0AAN8UUG9_9MAGN